MSASKVFKLIACFLLICALTGYTQSVGQTHGAIVFVMAAVIACLGFFAGEDF
ncbi:hypothetical protein [Azotobacter beijerinckii]|uniref:hypothetical protein n=1 Tax=Azotobacter beijerinckii TaxID=170623 RepID=UPI002955833E|nr:hypothetical protein [Azotobacter beijerinckii]MDV7209931.1 hypothetical protein [Azotobacter beijerinckii]